MATPAPASPLPGPAPMRGLGGLLSTDVDRIPLGTHHGRELHARVERRVARFSAGRNWHVSVALGRTRPVAIEVAAPGERYDLSIATSDPWFRAARRAGALALVATGMLAVARRLRR